MRVLLALNSSEREEEKIVQTYREKYGETIEVASVYFFKSLIDTVKKSAPFDRIVIHENLEPTGRKNKDVFDEYIFKNIDALTDESGNATIIFLCSDTRKRDDKLLNKMFNIGVYNILIGAEGTFSRVCELIKNPMTKKDAKRFLEVNVESETYEDPNKVSEIELRNILEYYQKNINNKENIISGFDNNLYEQYTIQKLRVIISFLPAKVRDILYVNSDKYRAVLGEVVKIVEVPVYMGENENVLERAKNVQSEKEEPKSKKGLFGGLLKKGKNAKKPSSEVNVAPKQTIEDFKPIYKPESFENNTTNLEERPNVVVEIKDNSTNETIVLEDKFSSNEEVDETVNLTESTKIPEELTVEEEPFKIEIPEEPTVEEEPFKIEIPEEPTVEEEPFKIEIPEEPTVEEEPFKIEIPEEPTVEEEPFKIEIPEEPAVEEEPFKIEIPEEPTVEEEPFKIEIPEEPTVEEEPFKIEIPEEPTVEEEPFKIEIPEEPTVEEEPFKIEIPEEPTVEEEPFKIEMPEETMVEEEPFKIEIPEEPTVEEEPFKIEIPEETMVEEETSKIEIPEEPIVEEETSKIEIPEESTVEEETSKVEIPEETMVEEETSKIEIPEEPIVEEETSKLEIPEETVVEEENSKLEIPEGPFTVDFSTEPSDDEDFFKARLAKHLVPEEIEEVNDDFNQSRNAVPVNNSGPQIQTVTQVIEREVIKEIYETPSDYKKVVAFVGTHKVGTTFIINAIANNLVSKGVKTAILDLTANKNMYSIYAANSTEYREIAKNSIPNLAIGQDVPLRIGDLSIYTGLPWVDKTRLDAIRTIDRIRSQNAVILVDCDILTNLDIFRIVNNIFVIQDMDVMNILANTSFLKQLKARDLDLDKIEVIVNKYMKSSLSVSKIIDALSYYTNPEMTFVNELFPKTVKRFIVPFDEQNYLRYLESLYAAKINFDGFSEEFKQSIASIVHDIFPISSTANINQQQEVIQSNNRLFKNLFKKKK